MADKVTMRWTDYQGREQTREVNQIIDVRDFLGTPGYSLLAVAANTHMSVGDIDSWLALIADEWPDVGRSLSWIQRRRWLFQQPDAVNNPGYPNKDGNDARAIEIMADNPTLSIRNLTKLLSDRGIVRSREWVRRHRCD